MDVKKIVCFSFDLFSQNSLAYLRLIAPMRHLGINIIDGMENGSTKVEKILEGDIVFIQRNFPRRFKDYQAVVEISRQHGKPIVYDLDDLLYSLPDYHPYRQTQDYTSSLLPMYQALRDADLVIVSSKKLKDVLGEYNENIVILTNFLDDDLWKLKPPVLKGTETDHLTIGYMGTASHKPDLEYITPALLEIKERYPNKIQMSFWGIDPPDEIRPFSNRITMPQFSIRNEYKDFANYFQTQSADIFIAPLVDNLFNRCKSPIKFLEYSALGVPGIYSSLEPYTQVISHGSNGLLAATLDDWSRNLSLLIENNELRLQIANNAQSTIMNEWFLSQNAIHWQEAFNALGGMGVPAPDKMRLDILQSINTQLTEIFTKVDNERNLMVERDCRIEELNSCVEQNAKTIQVLKEQLERVEKDLQLSRLEVSSFTQSTSWKITKLLRLIKKGLLNLKNPG